MAKRQPKPWFHKQSGNWKLQRGKEQTNLGPDESEAWVEYHKLMAAGPTSKSKDPTLYEFLERYLAFVDSKRSDIFQNAPAPEKCRRVSRQAVACVRSDT